MISQWGDRDVKHRVSYPKEEVRSSCSCRHLDLGIAVKLCTREVVVSTPDTVSAGPLCEVI